MSFDSSFDRLIKHEGGYVNDRRDSGGETRYGISKRSYPDEDIANITLERARDIYKRDYWDRIQGDQLPSWIAFQVFDASVNSGVVQASKWLQMAVGSQSDGIIGAKTVAITRQADPGATVARFNAFRLHAMTGMTGWQAFGKGWARRIADNLLEI